MVCFKNVFIHHKLRVEREMLTDRLKDSTNRELLAKREKEAKKEDRK